MKKNLVQDIVPPPKKSIRNIEIPSHRLKVDDKRSEPVYNRAEESRAPAPVVQQPVRPKPEKLPPRTFEYSASPDEPTAIDSLYKYEYDDKPKKPGRKILYTTVIIFILALAFGISALFKSAKITVQPKSQTINLSSNFTANKDDQNGLSFQVVTVNEDAQKTVMGTGQTEVQSKASGSVTIFNTTTQSQKLVATTRLETPEGLIFRLNSAVTVPARQSATVPGSVTTVATADQAGASYNVGLKDFTIPGFKGTSKYTTIYARSKTSMTGGFSGEQAVISPQSLASTSAELQNNLKTSLASDIVSQIPADFILYKNSMTFSFSPLSQASTTNSGTILDEKGTAYAVIFDRGSLSRSIASLYSITDSVKVDSLDSLDFEYATDTPFDPSGSGTTLNFSLAGNANIVWVFDSNKLETELLGLNKTQAKTVIEGYPAISEVWIETSPFWNQTIPSDPKKVELLTK